MQYHNAGTAGMLPVLQVIFSQKTLLIRLAVKARGREGREGGLNGYNKIL